MFRGRLGLCIEVVLGLRSGVILGLCKGVILGLYTVPYAAPQPGLDFTGPAEGTGAPAMGLKVRGLGGLGGLGFRVQGRDLQQVGYGMS